MTVSSRSWSCVIRPWFIGLLGVKTLLFGCGLPEFMGTFWKVSLIHPSVMCESMIWLILSSLIQGKSFSVIAAENHMFVMYFQHCRNMWIFYSINSLWLPHEIVIPELIYLNQEEAHFYLSCNTFERKNRQNRVPDARTFIRKRIKVTRSTRSGQLNITMSLLM